MSRVAKMPISLPKGVEMTAKDGSIAVKGPKGTLSVVQPAGVSVSIEGVTVNVAPAGCATDNVPFGPVTAIDPSFAENATPLGNAIGILATRDMFHS